MKNGGETDNRCQPYRGGLNSSGRLTGHESFNWCTCDNRLISDPFDDPVLEEEQCLASPALQTDISSHPEWLFPTDTYIPMCREPRYNGEIIVRSDTRVIDPGGKDFDLDGIPDFILLTGRAESLSYILFLSSGCYPPELDAIRVYPEGNEDGMIIHKGDIISQFYDTDYCALSFLNDYHVPLLSYSDDGTSFVEFTILIHLGIIDSTGLCIEHGFQRMQFGLMHRAEYSHVEYLSGDSNIGGIY